MFDGPKSRRHELHTKTNTVKHNIKRAIRSFLKDDSISAPIQFSQEIPDPDGLVLDITLARPRVFIADKYGNRIEFSAYVVSELRGSLLEVEKKFGQRFHHE